MNNTLYMVIPCYNEQEVLHETAKRLREKYSALISAGKISLMTARKIPLGKLFAICINLIKYFQA